MSREAKYAVTIGANLALGGLTGGIGEELRGGSFWRGFARGAAGGGLVFVGKEVSAQRFTGAGLLGRELGAVGGSVVNNAAAGRPMFSRIVLPVGPVRVYAQPGAPDPVRLKVDAAGVVGLAIAATRPGARFDVQSSLSSGAPVIEFARKLGSRERASHLAGVMMIGNDLEGEGRRRALAHERVHVVQYDFAFLAWSQPAEAWAAGRIPAAGTLSRYVDVSANAAVFSVLNVFVPRRVSPWEHEAYFLSGTGAPQPIGAILASPAAP
jgi:hypothetical protein